MSTPARIPHPVVWFILYIPFGALSGFVNVALTFLATQHGLSISQGALLTGSLMLISWLKWLWAPAVDITLSPKRWYVISTSLSAVGVLAMSVVPLEPKTLGLLLAVIAAASLVNSIVGMSAEAMIAATTPVSEIGRVSAWFQAGNLGGNGLGGALGLLLIKVLPSPWMSGAIMGVLFMGCCGALFLLPAVPSHAGDKRPVAAVKGVAVGLWTMLKSRAGFLSALLCILPLGTGAAQGTLTQAAVAAHWGANEHHVEWVQGLLSGLITMLGCFGGGWLCRRLNPRAAYAFFGLVLAAMAVGMAVSPATVPMYVGWNLIYSLGVGLAFAAFTAVALSALGGTAAATGYNVFASLSNFPIWWLGLLLGWVADHHGPTNMLLTEAGLGVAAVVVFVVTSQATGQPLLERTAAA